MIAADWARGARLAEERIVNKRASSHNKVQHTARSVAYSVLSRLEEKMLMLICYCRRFWMNRV